MAVLLPGQARRADPLVVVGALHARARRIVMAADGALAVYGVAVVGLSSTSRGQPNPSAPKIGANANCTKVSPAGVQHAVTPAALCGSSDRAIDESQIEPPIWRQAQARGRYRWREAVRIQVSAINLRIGPES
jgi:hypothetical protein